MLLEVGGITRAASQVPGAASSIPVSYDDVLLKRCWRAHVAHVLTRAMSAPLLDAWRKGKISQEWKAMVKAARLLMARLDKYKTDGSYVFPHRCYDCGKRMGLDVLGRKCLLATDERSGLVSTAPGVENLHWLCKVYVVGGTGLPPEPAGHAETAEERDTTDEAGLADF